MRSLCVVADRQEGSLSSIVIQDHVRPVGSTPRPALSTLLRVLFTGVVLAVRFLAAFIVGRGDLRYADKLLDIFWRRVFRWGNVALVVDGRERFAGRTAIVMSNHVSILDVPTLLGSVPGSVRMVFKQSLSRIPVWGWALVAAGFVPIDRGNVAKAIVQLENAKRVFAQGVHVWVSPEGTRSRGRGLLPFKKGGFHLAKQLGAPIIPAFIEGTEELISPQSARVLQDGTVRVRFGAPIESSALELDALMAATRRAIEELARAPRVG